MRIILVGLGSVGGATVRLLWEQRQRLVRDHGLNARIVALATSRGGLVGRPELDARDLLEGPIEFDPRLTALDLIGSVDADVVIEAGPTDLDDPRPAIDRLAAAFRSGKHAVSVNKAPLAVALPALLELARFNEVQFEFSGTVGGGTPFLHWARHCATGDDIAGLAGVLNGTSNFILTRMRGGAGFEEALAEAQALGYAEADPTADVDGIDAAIKLVILANVVLGERATLEDVVIRGIRDLAEPGSVRLVARAGAGLRVAPEEVRPGSPLAVEGTTNALMLELVNGGEMTLVGRGAGGPETATSVIRDLVSIWHRHWT